MNWRYERDIANMPGGNEREPPRCIRCDAELPDDLPIKHCQSCIDALEPTMSPAARQLWQNQKEQRRASNQD